MKKIRFQLKPILILASIITILSTSCAPIIPTNQGSDPLIAQQQVLQPGPTGSPAVATGTPPTQALTPVIPGISFIMLVTSYSEPYNAHIEMQVEQFKGQVSNKYPGLQIHLMFVPPDSLRDTLSTMIASGAPPAVASLDYNNVLEFHKAGVIEPAAEAAEFWGLFLNDAVNLNTRDQQILAYPWQRYSCSPNYTNLALLKNQSKPVMAAARDLILFLTSDVSQKSNLENPSLRAYPTLNGLDNTIQVRCERRIKVTLNPDPAIETMDMAREQSEKFFQIFQFRSNAAGAAGLDAAGVAELDGSFVNVDPGTLEAILVPAANGQQVYKDRQVIGFFKIINDRVSPNTISLQGKGSMQKSKLPAGPYVIACYPQTNNCLAVSETGQELYLDPDAVSWSILPVPVQVPVAAFIKGSIGGCIYIDNVCYCIYIF